MQIPKIIHQVWLNWEGKNIPESMQPLAKTWEKQNPDWEYRLWRNKDFEELIFSHYPQYIDLFSTMSTIEKADACRPLVLHRYGGLYVDLDFECLKPIEPLLKDKVIALASQARLHIIEAGANTLLANGFMASIPQQKFWIDYMTTINERLHQFSSPIDTTGPVALDVAYHQTETKRNISLLESDLVNPIPNVMHRKHWPRWAKKMGKIYRPIVKRRLHNMQKEIIEKNHAYAIHWWGASWTGTSAKKSTLHYRAKL